MTSKSCTLRHEDLLQASAIAPAAETAAVDAAAGHITLDQTAAVNVAADQAASAETATGHTASAETIVVRMAADQKTPAETVTVNIAAGHIASAETAVVNRAAPALKYSDPRTIYQRYVAARDAWYRAQPRGSVKTNQQYRKAMGLPQRYSKTDYQWCLDWKQMGKDCKMQKGSRDWTKEEMMAYLDWSKAEEDRVEAQVATEMEGNPFSSRRGMRDIWEAAARDIEAQEAFS
jgi:hypothetical protein